MPWQHAPGLYRGLAPEVAMVRGGDPDHGRAACTSDGGDRLGVQAPGALLMIPSIEIHIGTCLRPKTAARFSAFCPLPTRGTAPNIAHLLKMDKYYTGDEGAYSRSMTSKKAQFDRTLGPAK